MVNASHREILLDHKWSVCRREVASRKVGIKTKFNFNEQHKNIKKKLFGKKSAVDLEELREGQCYSPGPVKVD